MSKIINLSNFIEIETEIKQVQKSSVIQSYLSELDIYDAYFKEPKPERVAEEIHKEDEKDIIEIRHYKLQTRLSKEMKESEKKKENGVVQAVDMSKNHLDYKFMHTNLQLIDDLMKFGGI